MSKEDTLHLKPLQIPLMYAFRDAAARGDSRREEHVHDASGARVLTERGSIRRRGANENQLRRNLDTDLGQLLNSIALGSVVDLTAHPRVQRSVLNFGVPDMSHLTSDALTDQTLATNMRKALEDHEPRLLSGSIAVTQSEEFDSVHQRISVHIEAEMLCRPVDVPLEFTAEIDMGSGKVKLLDLAAGAPGGRAARDSP